MDHPAKRRTHRPSRPHPLRRPRRRTRPRQSGPRPRRRARLAASDLRAKKQRHAHRSVRKRRPVRRRTLVGDAQRRRRRVPVAARLLPGTLIGSNRGTHASRLLAQVALTGDNERRVRLAASLIGAKIRGQIHVLTRIARRDEAVHVADTTAHMHAWRCSLAGARTLDEVMGIEGACSNAYFDALVACVPADVIFDGRSRRPPRDLPNAALSYGYAILLSECVGALHAAGLEPSLGIAHAPTDKRPSLALDLMEQFRPLLVDQTVMALLRTRKLRPEHGVVEAEAGGVWLGSAARKSSSTRTRPPASDPSPEPSPDTRDRGAGTTPTPRRCWRAPSPNPTTRGAGSPGDDLHHRLRHRRQ